MKPRELKITFTDSPQEEIALVQKEFHMSELAKVLQKTIDTGESLNPEERMQVAQVVAQLQDMFSLDLPELEENVEITLRKSSRDINLSRILRERGVVRFYRLLRELDENGLPVYQSLLHPYEGTPFSRQEDFIRWVAKEAHMPRSTLFMRFSTYDKMINLGFDLEQAFQTVITKPYAMREVLNMLGKWDDSKQLIGVNPDVAKKVANKVLPSKEAEKIEELVDTYNEQPNSATLQSLATNFKPAFTEFVSELAEHPNTREMMDFVRHDIIGKPEIEYRWKRDALIVRIIRKAIDENGNEVEISFEEIPFVPDVPHELPDEIVSDLLTRLPIKNRKNALLERELEKQKREEEKEKQLRF